MTIVTDASMEGWGGHLGNWVISGELDCLGQAPYQLARAPGGIADHATLLAPVAW